MLTTKARMGKEFKIYYITYDLDGGTGNFPPQKKRHGGDEEWVRIYNYEPTKSGATFQGWLSDLRPNLYMPNNPYGWNSDTILHAQWGTNTYTIYYNVNGGTGSFPNQTRVHDGPYVYTHSHSPTRTGYTFLGWLSPLRPDRLYNPNMAYGHNASTTMTAQWQPNTYTITFNSNGGTTANPASKIVTYDDKYGALPAPTRVGYTLKGWYTATSGGTLIPSSAVVKITTNRTFYAQWTPATHIITFDANGGNIPNPKTKIVTYDQPYGELASCTRAGYTRTGWYTAKTGGSQILTTTTVKITGNQTLYARWTPATYAVTYNTNGASSPTPATQYKTYGQTLKLHTGIPSRQNWVFRWWAGSDGVNYAPGANYTKNAPLTLTASWRVVGESEIE